MSISLSSERVITKSFGLFQDFFIKLKDFYRRFMRNLRLLNNNFFKKLSMNLNNSTKIAIIGIGFLILILIRLIALRFNFHLGFLSLLLICLSGFWFGIRGGLISSVIASVIFIFEVYFLQNFPEREFVIKSIYLRFLGFAWGGILTGFIFEYFRFKSKVQIKIKNDSYYPEIKNRVLLLFNSIWIKIIFIIIAYLVIELMKLKFSCLSFFLDYCFVVMICICGFWFGVSGGLVGATITFSLFILSNGAENVMKNFLHQSMIFSMFFCYFIGIFSGIIYEIENIFKSRLKDLAYFDELTGCLNFRSIIHILEVEISRAVRHKKNIVVILLDIDNFKKINDKHGHKFGNEALKIFAETVRSSIRKEDYIGRFGGDEFLLILPETKPNYADRSFNKIKTILETRLKNYHFKFHFSAGASYFPWHGSTKEMLLCAADNALYEAKRRGKNQFNLERRKSLRIKPIKNIKSIIKIYNEGKEITDFEIVNISREGMSLLFNNNNKVKLLNDLVCSFQIPSVFKNYATQLQCKIVHKYKNDHVYCVGVYFNEIPEDILQKIISKKN